MKTRFWYVLIPALLLGSCNNFINDLQVSYQDPVLTVTRFPDKTEYLAGEELDLRGLEVSGTDRKGAALSGLDKLEFSGFDSSIPGVQTITVTHLPSGAAGTFTVTVQKTVQEIVPSLSLDVSGTHIFTGRTAGYAAAPNLLITVKNTGTGPTGAITLSCDDTASFTLSKYSIVGIPARGSETFTIEPNTGLGPGTYTAAVTVSGGGETHSFDVSFTVNLIPSPVLILSETGTYTFPGTAAGSPVPAVLSVTVRNAGDAPTGALAVTLSGTGVADSFELSEGSLPGIPAGDTASFTVQPKAGLPVKTYTAVVTVKGSGLSVSFTVSFTVMLPQPGSPNLIVRGSDGDIL